MLKEQSTYRLNDIVLIWIIHLNNANFEILKTSSFVKKIHKC